MLEPVRARALASRLEATRRFTERLCAPLEIEDYVVQSMPDASPAKWHLAHTTWFFETFVLAPYVAGYRPYRAPWGPLFNSYYEAVGPRQPRPQRGLLTRPTVREIYAYRAAVDEQLASLLARERGTAPEVLARIELGLEHEQQHQELILTDLQHAFFCNPLHPAYRNQSPPAAAHGPHEPAWIEHGGGLCRVGHDAPGFAFDNESPAHRVYLEPFAVSSRLVTLGQYLEFIADGGYARPELWLSDGWARARAEGWDAPLYVQRRDDAWARFSLYGTHAADLHSPVCHVSYYEADAFARWAGHRLPSEHEWEVVARESRNHGQFIEDDVLIPTARPDGDGLLGGTWVWTRSPYVGYPGYSPAAGALGEYNGKFMVNQLVLRGGSCFSSRSHLRCTYRNFFPPETRWQVTGIRLGRHLSS
jgi:ergothioneine biosynthesis protein EgtB